MVASKLKNNCRWKTAIQMQVFVFYKGKQSFEANGQPRWVCRGQPSQSKGQNAVTICRLTIFLSKRIWIYTFTPRLCGYSYLFHRSCVNGRCQCNGMFVDTLRIIVVSTGAQPFSIRNAVMLLGVFELFTLSHGPWSQVMQSIHNLCIIFTNIY